MQVGECRDHLFISYAWEDAALARWLALKLTCMGYAVWIDSDKLLGGEPYPTDIDLAIKARTFRMLALLSRSSVHKPNPSKERTLALNLARERGCEFLIPLNVDGLSPTELDWMTSDLTFIPFEHNWADGLKRLVRKLGSIDAPRPVTDGAPVAASVYLPELPLENVPETIHTNCLPFVHVPGNLVCYDLGPGLSAEEWAVLDRTWPHYAVSPGRQISFFPPPNWAHANVVDAPVPWRNTSSLQGVKTLDMVSSLLRKALRVAGLGRGLQWDDRADLLYFPVGLVPGERLSFRNYTGRKTYLLVTSERSAPSAKRFRYHWGLSLDVRGDVTGDFLAVLRLGARITDPQGAPLPGRSLTSRQKTLRKAMWNHHWLSRQNAMLSFLSGGEACITVGPSPGEQVVLAAEPLTIEAPCRVVEKSGGGSADGAGPDDELISFEDGDPG